MRSSTSVRPITRRAMEKGSWHGPRASDSPPRRPPCPPRFVGLGRLTPAPFRWPPQPHLQPSPPRTLVGIAYLRMRNYRKARDLFEVCQRTHRPCAWIRMHSNAGLTPSPTFSDFLPFLPWQTLDWTARTTSSARPMRATTLSARRAACTSSSASCGSGRAWKSCSAAAPAFRTAPLASCSRCAAASPRPTGQPHAPPLPSPRPHPLSTHAPALWANAPQGDGGGRGGARML